MSKICLVTLGCPKNIVEGESIAGLLRAGGWELTTNLTDADAAVIHTCSFISDAKKESEDVINSLSRLKIKGKLKTIAVTGCLVQREGKSLREKFKGVDVFIGTGALGSLTDLLEKGAGLDITRPGGLLESSVPRLLSSSLPSAYLRIAEGCNHKCSFCIIPGLRGRYKSRKKEDILSEAKDLADCGIKEINIIAQDTTLYGKDIYSKPSLPVLLNDLAGIKGFKWIRLMYAFPGTVTGGLIDVIKNEEKVCKYIDMPVQHINDKVLKLMGRPTGAKNVIRRLKDQIPGLTLRSTVITGFPGEKEKEFRELADFVSEGWFDHLGVFEYNPIEGTPSSRLSGRPSARVAGARKKELMLRQQKVVRSRFESMKGDTVEVIIESRQDDDRCTGRASFQAPEIDGGMIIKGSRRLGSFVKVKITGSKGYDLKADL